MSGEYRRYDSFPDRRAYRQDEAYRANDDADNTRFYSDFRHDCKPITRRIGAGRRARIAVDTAGAYTTALDDTGKNEADRRRAELERRRMKAVLEAKRKKANEEALRLSERTSGPPPRPSPRIHMPTSEDSGDSAEILNPVPPETLDAQEAYPPLSSPSSSPPEVRTYDDQGDYDFKIPVKLQAVTYQYVEDVSFPLETDSNNGAGNQSPSRPNFSGAVTSMDISKSHWIGSGYDRGDVSADISVSTGGKDGEEKHREALMRWHHLERAAMSFEEFVAAAQGVLQISESKKRDVNRLLRDVQRRFEKQRQHGRDLEPNCVSDVYVGDSTSKQSACVMFMSFPYFCLAPYNAGQLKNLTPGTSMHPLRPLLQAHFHSTSQKRELAQAITSFSNTGDGNCLHLSQIWCLIVDGDTMLTCSRPSLDGLRGEAITKSDASVTDNTANVTVSLGGDRSWQIPVKDSTTWPEFLSVFGESIARLETDGVIIGLEVNHAAVDAEQWPSVVRAAQTGSVGLDLRQTILQPGGPAYTAIPDTGAQKNTNTTPAAGNVRTEQSEAGGSAEESMHEPTVEPIEASASKEDTDAFQIFHYALGWTLNSLADSLDGVLRMNNRETERAAYERGSRVKATAIVQLTANMEMRSAPNASQNGGNKLGLIGLAVFFFRFFWPFTWEHPVADKYWGALEALLSRDDESLREAKVDDIFAELTDTIVPLMQALTREFSNSPRALEPLPDAYSKAFLHLMIVFILLSQTTGRQSFGINNSTIRAHIKGAREQLTDGKREIATRLKDNMPDLEEVEVCSSASLLTLVLKKFSQDVMQGKPDVASTYSDYFAQLDFRITEDPAPRSHQESLRFFQQETEAILSTLQYQLSVLNAFEQSLKQQSEAASGDGGDNFLLQYALGESRQQIVLDECKARITARIDKFRGLQQRAEDLGEWHRNEMETNKDRQENAIMVFTIVTIIFLPLSFVSSVFGMNTSDVRDMPYSQWAYWAAGIPLTVFVVVGSLWWAGEFEGFGAWVEKAFRRASSASGYHRGYGRIPEPVGYGRAERQEIDVRYAGGRMERARYSGERRRRTTYPRRRAYYS